MTDTAETIAAARRRDQEAALVEPAAAALAAACESTAFRADLPETQERVFERDIFRERARLVLDAAGAFDTAREVRRARTMRSWARHRSLAVEQEIAEANATVAHRDATIAGLRADDAGHTLALHNVTAERDLLVEAIGKLVSLPPQHVADTYGVRYQATPAPRAGDRVEDGGLMGTLVRCPECGGGGLLHKPDHYPTGPAPQPEETPAEDAYKPSTPEGN
ncbi:hypothetical protein [Micromonospora sp. WMMD737]|uniref:hypothetical protein n=1 Tax=Micromonospora sp. WMMD737 TaxID=3404113 RepID=UPI003B9465ED